MAARDLDKAAGRFLAALRRVESGLTTQRERILARAAAAPRLLPGSHVEVVDLTGDAGTDLDYYVYELGRLEAAGRSILKVFGRPRELLDAQAAFGEAIPRLRDIRNPLTHPNDNDELAGVGWFSSLVRQTDDGRTETLVDPRYGQHEAALTYARALTTFL